MRTAASSAYRCVLAFAGIFTVTTLLALSMGSVEATSQQLVDLGAVAPQDGLHINLCQGEAGAVEMLGNIDSLILDDPSDPWSGGIITVAGQSAIVPKNLLIDLPANRLSLQQLFADAPAACVATGESGLASADICTNGDLGSVAVILANIEPDFRIIIGDMFIMKAASNPGGLPTGFIQSGMVTYANYDEGYVVINGTPGDPTTGLMIRPNDPEGVHTVQRGAGCSVDVGGNVINNCSPDVRFTNDPSNYTLNHLTGVPWCIPSTVARDFTDENGNVVTAQSNEFGEGDALCPASNKEDFDPATANWVVPDSRRFVPLLVGDPIGAEGNFETVNGVTFFSAHTIVIELAPTTRDDPSQPDYLLVAEVEGDVPGFSNARLKGMAIGMDSFESQIDVSVLDIDPATNENKGRIILSTVGNPHTVCMGVNPLLLDGAVLPGDVTCSVDNGGNIFKILFDIDFITGVGPKRSFCANQFNAGLRTSAFCSLGEEFAAFSPITREMIMVSRHQAVVNAAGSGVLDINGNPAVHGEYLSPQGIGHPEFDEVTLTSVGTAFQFDGIPWNLDRRLGPGGCVDTDGDGVVDCESLVDFPLGTLGLDPFPWDPLDPRERGPRLDGDTVDIPLGGAARVLSHWPHSPGAAAVVDTQGNVITPAIAPDQIPWPPVTAAGQDGGVLNCNDGDPCTVDSCDEHLGCVHTPSTGDACNDGDACTLNDVCNAGVCEPGPLDCTDNTCTARCDDGNDCTDDGCAAGACTTTNNVVPCDDGDECTTGDSCNGLGACVGGAPPICDDGDPCTADSCDSLLGCVEPAGAAGIACDDGDACTSNDQCDGVGACQGGGATDCNDNNPCTDDFCNSAGGCVNVANTGPCSDGDACTVGDQCAGGLCVSGATDDCDDGDICTVDSCDAAGGCINTFAGGACNDGNPCTDDVCDAVSGCVSTANTAACDDGDPCTSGDTCQAEACVGGGPTDCSDGNACTDDSCGAGGCVHSANAGNCDDGNECTTIDLCSAGACVGSGSPDCDDLNLCTTDSCNPFSGCTSDPNTSACDDGDACTENDTCAAGECLGSVIAPACGNGCIEATETCGEPDMVGCALGDACGAACTCEAQTCAILSMTGPPALPATGQPLEVNVLFNVGAIPLGSYSVDLAWDPAVLQLDSVAGGSTSQFSGAPTCNINNAAGTANCAGLNASALNIPVGSVHVANLNMTVVDASGGEATVTVTAGGISDTAGDPIPECNASADLTMLTGCGDVNGDSSVNIVDALLTAQFQVGLRTCSQMARYDACDITPDGSCNIADALRMAQCSVGLIACDFVCSPLVCSAPPAAMMIDLGGETADLHLPSGQAEVSISLPAGNPGPGQFITGELVIDTGSPLGAYGIDINCDPALMRIVPPVSGGNTGEFSGSPVQNVSGCSASLSGFQFSNLTGPSGLVSVASVQFEVLALAAPGSTSLVDLATSVMADTSGNPISATDLDSTVTIGGGCGNGSLELGEQCDDGNNTPGDCCSASCTLEVGSCNDGDACTTGDTCQAGSCVGGTAPDCNDGNLCTDDSCNSLTGCVNVANTATCDDGDACTTNDLCSGGSCQSGATADCGDGNICTVDSCNSASGCQNLPSNAACDDSNDCTDDSCAANACSSTPNSASCDDGDACTTGDTCAVGSCSGSAVDCDDGNLCTTDSCNAASGCTHAANSLACDDGVNCTSGETCSAGICQGGIPVVCNDGDACTDDQCNEADGSCSSFGNTGPACDDGDACTADDACFGGNCVGVTPVDCGDGNVCTDDVCDPASGCSNPVNTVACDDGDACTTADTCSAGSCVGGAAPDCNDSDLCTADSCDSASGCTNTDVSADCGDGNVCTTDSCDAALGCVNAPNTASCDDGDACTQVDACDGAGACAGSDPVVCTASDHCHDAGSCAPATGLCSDPASADGTPCDDGNACTTGDTCQAGVCVGGAAPDCNDGNVCTADSCDAAIGCQSVPVALACDDGNACTVNDACSGGSCTGTTRDCNDGNDCTNDSCDPASGCASVDNTAPCDDGNACTTADTCAAGSCVGGAAPDCNDGNVCTSDSCDTALGCLNLANAVACDDGDACTDNDSCSSGQCQGGGAANCDDANPCTVDLCDSATGCQHFNVAIACDDGDACTTDDQCSSGACVGGPPANCNDGNVCTDDSCDAGLGCVNAANTAQCSDGDACTTGDICSAGACGGADTSADDCDDGNVCTTDSCDAASGCANVANAVACDDGDACTTVDLCVNGACVGAVPPDCDDANGCTDDSCDSSSGCVTTDNTASCEDGDACTTADTCQAGACVGGAAPNCDDANECTDDTCDSASGCAHGNNTGSCDDGDPTTVGDQCVMGACVSGNFGCPAAPALECTQPYMERKSKLQLKNSSLDSKDKLVWKWSKGGATTTAAMGDPLATTEYALCMWDEEGGVPVLVMENHVLPGNGWKGSASGFQYKDRVGAPNGVGKVKMKAGPDGKAKFLIKAQGASMAIAPMPLSLDDKLTVQFVNNSGGCWQSDFGAPASRNNTALFKGISSFK